MLMGVIVVCSNQGVDSKERVLLLGCGVVKIEGSEEKGTNVFGGGD